MRGKAGAWMLAGCLFGSLAQAQSVSTWDGITLQLGGTPAFVALLGEPAEDPATTEPPSLDLTLNADATGTRLDWRPLSSGFRVSGAVLFDEPARPVDARLLPAARPYLGLGWGESWNQRLSLSLDVGVLFPGLGWARRAAGPAPLGGATSFSGQPGDPVGSYDPLLQIGLDYSF